jgi:antitoxin component YwqK of YwqJK toxin-antitoxin module
MKNLLLLAVTILVVGCGVTGEIELSPEHPLSKALASSEKPTTETQPELDGVNRDKIEYRLDNLYYLKGSDVSYTGKVFEEWSGQQRVETNYIDGRLDGLSQSWHENGKKASEVNYKGGKQDGLLVEFHENGQKWREVNYKDGTPVEGSEKFWNSKGDPVDSMKESFKKLRESLTP